MKSAPVTAEVSRCQAAVETFVNTLAKDQEPEQAYRNLAFASATLKPFVKAYGQGAREHRVMKTIQGDPASELYAQIQQEKGK